MALRLLVLAAVLLACARADDLLLRASHHQELLGAKANPRQAFAVWTAKHGKGYSNDLLENEKRYNNWVSNLEFALDYNSRTTSHWVGMNALADLSHEEYLQKYGLGTARFNRAANAAKSARIPGFKHGSLDAATLPPAVDWRAKSAVAEVKNQMSCGSCWAFSTTGSIEGINAIVTGELVSLSEQYLVDCDTAQDQGCQGGLMDYAFEYVAQSGGIELERDYPYTGEDGECAAEENRRMVTIDGYQDVPNDDEVALKKAASQQPVSVAIQASQRAFQLYVGGVFDDKECGTQLDHGVLVVGYGTDDGGSSDDDDDEEEGSDGGSGSGGDGSGTTAKLRNYWIVKNSWGSQWGDKGFIKMRMGRGGKQGLCGIATQPSYPIKTSPNPPAPPPGPPAPVPPPKPAPVPPPPKPEPVPVECDASHECPPDNTCCCLREAAGFCFTYGCCPMPKATCCPDKLHCCPSDLPVCDTDSGRCLPPTMAGLTAAQRFAASVPWAAKQPARRKAPALSGAGFSRKAGFGGALRPMVMRDDGGAWPAAA